MDHARFFRLLQLLLFLVAGRVYGQAAVWQGKQCAVVLTYDDAIDADLDNVIPALDSAGLKGTFYLIASSDVVGKRLEEWRLAATHGHELGNHSLFHPCDGGLPGRDFAKGEYDLRNYSVIRAVAEIKAANILLKSIDGRTQRTFAYPCGDLRTAGTYFYKSLENDFVGARGTVAGMQAAGEVDLSNIACFAINGQSAEYMIGLVRQAQVSHALLVFLFHGVGGGHPINVSLDAHSKLIHYLKEHQGDIWVTTMVDAAGTVRAYQAKTARH